MKKLSWFPERSYNKWVKTEGRKTSDCPKCGKASLIQSNYCPHCGKRLRKE